MPAVDEGTQLMTLQSAQCKVLLEWMLDLSASPGLLLGFVNESLSKVGLQRQRPRSKRRSRLLEPRKAQTASHQRLANPQQSCLDPRRYK